MAVEYETVSARMRAQGWPAGADSVDRFVERLRQRGKLPPADNEGSDRFFSHPDFDLDREARVAIVRGNDGSRVVRLRPQEFKILDLFSRNQDIILKREDVLRELWPGSGGNAHLLTAHLSRMRYELGIHPGIETVRKVGYVLRSGESGNSH